MSRIGQAFERARAEDRAAFVAYWTAGDPSPAESVRIACALAAAGADVIELGVPFSDPIADGPVLQRSAQRALAARVDFPAVLRIARAIRSVSPVPLLLFTYLNPVLRHGVARAAKEAADAGVDGVLFTDLPVEEAGPIRSSMRRAGLDTVFLVAPGSSPARMARAVRCSTGFLYVVSRPGTTGAREKLPGDLNRTVRRARRAAGRLPLAVGFGIASPGVAHEAARVADGVVVGSALVAAGEGGDGRIERVARLARALSRACRRNA